MSRKLAFLINPISGTRNKDVLTRRITSRCTREGVAFEILATQQDGNYHFLKEKIKKEGLTDVVICGGDGSISPVVSSLLGIDVNIGILPLGSGNGLAHTAGIPFSVSRALNIIFTGTPVYVDAFKINGRLGCQITGLGFDALIARKFSEERKRGITTYTKLAVKYFFKATDYKFSIACDDDEPADVNAYILCVSNANQFGNNLKIAPRASLNDGLLDVVILKETNKLRILTAFVNHLLFARKTRAELINLGKEKISYFNCRRVTIKNKNLAPVHVDGDPLEPAGKYLIEVVPSAYRLIYPG